MAHHFSINLSEHTMQDPVAADINEQCNRHCADRDKPNQLICSLSGTFLSSLSQILPRHDSASCGQR